MFDLSEAQCFLTLSLRIIRVSVSLLYLGSFQVQAILSDLTNGLRLALLWRNDQLVVNVLTGRVRNGTSVCADGG